MPTISQTAASIVPTTRQYADKRYHLYQVIEHRVEKGKPNKITAKNLISDIIYIEQVEWIITSLQDGITIKRPDFEGETIQYSEEKVKSNTNMLTPKTTENNIPVFGY
jgi:hypothetical protein